MSEAEQAPAAVSFEEFRDHLGTQLEVDLSGAAAGDRLGDDLELDSVQRLEALVAVEDLGVYLPDDCVGPEQTLVGLHTLYATALAEGGEPPDETR